MKPLFVDTGPLVAIAYPHDQFAAVARRGWHKLIAEPRQLVSTELVLVEVATLVGRWQGQRQAGAWVQQQLDSGLIRWTAATPQEYRRAADLIARYADRKIGLADAVSFVLMRRLRIAEAFTFDGHFTEIGFQQWPVA